ncbi:MAG: hypothetical protein IKK14_05340 [Oscillospiraceae bacterium]|nr:hypothetical protein [Oscillospiraceae bacterium]
MKKIFVFLLAFAMVVSFAACGTNEEKSFATVNAKDCFRDAGYIQLFKDGAAESTELTFTAENSEGTEWSVYVFDEKFEDGFRYISQAAEPVLTGNGSIVIEPGQFVYIYCSTNEFTSEAPDENAKLNIYIG